MKKTILIAVIALIICSGCNRASSKSLMDGVASTPESQTQSGVKVAVTPEKMKASDNITVLKGRVFEGNYANLGFQQIQVGNFKQTPYTVYLIGAFGKPKPGFPTDTATMVWLTRKLEQIPCAHPDHQNQTCYKELIVDTTEVPDIKVSGTKIIMPEPLQDVPCTLNNIPILALRSKPIDKPSKSVIAAWRFDLANERIIPVPPNDVDCKNNSDEEVNKARAYDFLIDGSSVDANHGIEGLRQIGKVLKEDVKLIQREDNPSQKDEFHTIQYDGMSISVYLAHNDGSEKLIVTDIVITSPKWPVKYGLKIGSTRKQIEQTLGQDMQSANQNNEWSYGDGPTDVKFVFDNEDKVTSIEWHVNLD